MALSKVDYNSMNVTPAASKAIKFNSSNNGLEAGDLGANLVLLATQTASSSATISFTSNIDSTYDEYVFKFYDIHPSADAARFQVNFRDGGSAYDAIKTTTFFRAYNFEDDSDAVLGYLASRDLAQSTDAQKIAMNIGNDNDQSAAGTLHLFNPSSTTFVKHFIARSNCYGELNYSQEVNVAGYCNVTAAIDGVQFSLDSGNIDAGTIKMYGVS